MHHYDKELFLDRRRSSFIELLGFGQSKRKSFSQDPAAKKRKIKAEIEMSSKNDDNDAYKTINQNENEEN